MKWQPAHASPEDPPSRSHKLHHRLIIAAIIILCLALLALASKRVFSGETASAAQHYAAPVASVGI